MKKVIVLLLTLILVTGLIGCTEQEEQEMVENYGSEMTVYLEPNTKLIEITWKESNLWYLTRPMKDDDIVENYVFQQYFLNDVFKRTVNIIETKATNNQLKEYKQWKNEGVISNWKQYYILIKHGYELEDIKNGNVDYSIFDEK